MLIRFLLPVGNIFFIELAHLCCRVSPDVNFKLIQRFTPLQGRGEQEQHRLGKRQRLPLCQERSIFTCCVGAGLLQRCL